VYPKQSRPANDDLTLSIAAGEIFGLLGDNGAGKTTLVKQMANLLRPTSGTIQLLGRPLDHRSLWAAGQIGYMPQNNGALNSTTVSEALYFTAHLRGCSRAEAQRERDRVIELLGLGEVRDRVNPRLSGGQKRLLLLATALVAHPPIIILDEPTNELAPQNRALVWDVLRRVNAEEGATIILVTHNVLEAETVIQRVGIMKAGKLVALGRPAALKAELNQRLRLEITFDPDAPPMLPSSARPQVLSPGRWLLHILPQDAAAYLACLSQEGGHDFRLSTATLEDLYLSMVE
jgi:ABC-2 type transport system ATP-binding protein/ABC-2 type transport system permease protein